MFMSELNKKYIEDGYDSWKNYREKFFEGLEMLKINTTTLKSFDDNTPKEEVLVELERIWKGVEKREILIDESIF